MLRIVRYLTAWIFLIAIPGCIPSGTSSTEPTTESTPNTSANGVDTIDSEAKAREFAAMHINEFIASQSFTDDAGNATSPPLVEPDMWSQVERDEDRWTLKRGPPGNWYFRASFNTDGSNPEYEAVYFSE